jgi:hypothetical protein
VILILAEQELEQRRIARLLSPLKVFRSSRFPNTSHQAAFGVVVILASDSSSVYARESCAEVHRRGHECRGVFVTRFEPDNVRSLLGLWSGEVVWLQTMEGELKRQVEGLLAQELQRRIFDMFYTSSDDPGGPLKQGLRAAFLDPIPPLTQKELVSVVGVSEEGFRNSWRAAGLPGRSEALIDWGLLTRVVSARGEQESMNRLCYRLSIEPWRIQRAAKRRVGIPAGELNEEHLIKALRSWVG